MLRPFLEIASWVAGIVSALVAVWLFLVPTDKDTVRAAASATVAPKPLPSSEALQSPKPLEEVADISSVVATCPTIEAIEAALNTVQALSTFSRRDAGYVRLLDDALCRADLALAERITALMSTSSARDAGYHKIVRRMIVVGDFVGAEKVVVKLSTFSARDNARHAIVEGIRKKGS